VKILFHEFARWCASRLAQKRLRLRSVPFTEDRSLGSVLIVAPHPDDESLGCGRLIASLCQQGRRVDVVWLTDGEASHPDFPGGPAQLANLRRREAHAAARILGVSELHLHHLGAPDGQLSHLSNDQRTALVGQISHLVGALRPSTVFVTSGLDGSTEHAAAHALVRAAFAGATPQPQLSTYLVWAHWNVRALWSICRRGEVVKWRADPAQNACRAAAIRAYKSQTMPLCPQKTPLISRHFIACHPAHGEFYLEL
jgi:LmbE family N-acetylglucosaminyl deacetylase